MSTNEITLAVGDQSLEQARFLPVMSLATAVNRRNIVVEAVKKLMEEDQDYGIIPGAKKRSLYQPGADKLNNLFGLVPKFTIDEKTEDWTGDRHGGEPFFAYTVTCHLFRGDYPMGEGAGSANSWESKYRYRQAERVCPQCGQATIIKGKEEYGGGWLCFAKRGGCGARFKSGDRSIEGQQLGRVANPDIFDLVNTILKMAHKRAKIAATLNATSAHEFFSQDLGDDDQTPPAGSPDEPPPNRPAAATVTMTPVPDELLLLWSNFVMPDGKTSNIDGRQKVFKQLKGWLILHLGKPDGEAEYYRILRETANVEHSNQIKTQGPARRASQAMWESVKRAETLAAQKTVPAADDVPQPEAE